MALTVYSMGDMPIFTSVLNAVAMVFNSSMFDPMQGAPVVVIGLLLGIFFMVMPAMGGGKLNPMPFIFVVLLFYAGVLPKERLQIEDIYSGQVTAVDNIPLVVALPASLAASLTRGVTDKVETAFSTTSGSYLSMGAEGFVNPLKLMLGLRDPNQTMRAFPYLSQSITEFVKYCAPTDATFSTKLMSSSPDMVGYLIGLQVAGVMTYWDVANPLGLGTSCPQGQANLKRDTQAAQMQADADNLLKTSTAGEYAKSANGMTLGASLAGLTQAYSSMTGGIMGNMQSAQQFMVNAVAMAPVKQGVDCINQPTGPNMSECMSNVIQREALEKQNMDAAAQAGIFTKTMIPAMNILLVLFYAFSPIVIGIAFMAGPHGIKMITGLFVFGVWTQTWMPIAAVINYMIQLQTQYAFSAFPASGMTMENYMQFYSILTMKLGMASTLMSMVPIISFSLLTGSVMALTSLANGMNAKDYVDESKAAPSLGTNKSITENGSWVGQGTRVNLDSTTGAGAGWDVGRNAAYNPMSKVNLTDTQRKSYEQAQTNAHTAQRSVDRTLANTLTSAASSQKVTEWAQGVQKTTAATDSHAATSAQKWVADLAKTEDMSKEDQELLAVGIGAQLLGNELTAKKAFSMMKKQGIAQKITDTQAFQSEQSRVHKEESNRSFAKNLKTNAASVLKNDNSDQVSQAISESEKAEESLKRSEQRSREVGLGNEQDMQTLGAQAANKLGAGVGSLIDSKVEEKDQQAYKSEEQRLLHNLTSSGTPMTAGARAAAKLQALHSVNADSFMEVLQATELAGMHNTQAPRGVDVGTANKPLQAQARNIDQDRRATSTKVVLPMLRTRHPMLPDSKVLVVRMLG